MLRSAVLSDEVPHVVDRAGRGGTSHQVQAAAVTGDPLERRPKARVASQLGLLTGLGRCGVAAQDLLLDVLDLHRAALLRQVGERRFHGDQPLDQVFLFVLEAHVEDAGLATGSHVASHLERHGGLARSLGPTDQQQLAGSQASADRLVEGHESGGDGLELVDLARRDALVEAGQYLERGAWREGPFTGFETPVRSVGRGGIGERIVGHRDGRLPRISLGSLGCRGACTQRRRVYDPPPSVNMTRKD